MLKVWSSKERREPSVHKDGDINIRYALYVSRWSLDLYREYKEITDVGDWIAGIYYNVSITKHFHLGSTHCWYDGPRHSFSLGFIHFNWMKWGCKGCAEEA